MSRNEFIKNTLTEPEYRFVKSYLLDFNKTYTARRLGLSKQTVYNWLDKSHIQIAIEVYAAKVSEKCDVTLEQVMNELKRLAFYNLKDHVKHITDSGVTFKEFAEMDGRALAEVTTQTTSDGMTFTSIKVHGKLKALEILAKILENAPDEKHVHFHVDSEELKGKSAAECAQAYVDLLHR